MELIEDSRRGRAGQRPLGGAVGIGIAHAHGDLLAHIVRGQGVDY